MHREAFVGSHFKTMNTPMTRRPITPSSRMLSPLSAVGRSFGLRVPVALMLLAASLVLVSSLAAPAVAQDALIWDPSSSNAGGTDGAGTWNNATPARWFDTTLSSVSTWPGSGTYGNATIGSGGTITGTTDQITVGAPIQLGNLTFGTMSATSIDYNVVDTSFGSNPLILNNVNSSAIPVTTLTSNTNVASHTTDLDVNMVAPSPFTLNVLGTGNIGVGGSIGVSTGVNNAAGSLRVGTTGSSTGYTGALFLSGNNNISSTVINSGTTIVTNSGSLGSGPVTLAGGTLQIFQGAIGLNIAGDATAGSFNQMTIGAGTTIGSGGAYATAQWNNFVVNRSNTVGTATLVSALGGAMTDNGAILTPANVSALKDRTTFSQATAFAAGIDWHPTDALWRYKRRKQSWNGAEFPRGGYDQQHSICQLQHLRLHR